MSWNAVAIVGAVLTAAVIVRLIIRLGGGAEGANDVPSNPPWLSSLSDSCASNGDGDCGGGGDGGGD